MLAKRGHYVRSCVANDRVLDKILYGERASKKKKKRRLADEKNNATRVQDFARSDMGSASRAMREPASMLLMVWSGRPGFDRE